MGRFAYLILICLMRCPLAVYGIVKDARTSNVNSPIPRSALSKLRIFKSSMGNYVDKLFEETDTNADGMVSFEEAYVGCLLLYVRLNRRAPIPPPSREKFRRIFLKTTNKTPDELNYLDKDEYGKILRRILGRALLRLTSHKVVTLIGAPLLAEMIVRSLATRKEGFEHLLRGILPIHWQDALIPTLTSKAFHRGFWMVILVMTLGNTCLAAVTFLLDLGLPKCISTD